MLLYTTVTHQPTIKLHRNALHCTCRSMPSEWWGLRDDKLSEVAGVPGAVFCHASGFIGGHATYEGVLAMARKSLPASDAKP